MTSRRSASPAIVWAAAAVALVVLLVVMGYTHPVRRAPIATDRLGPSSGDTVSDYLASARASLDQPTESTDAARWALVSLVTNLSTDRIADVVSGVRVSEVYVHVPISRVQTQVLRVPVSAHPDALAGSVVQAAGMVAAGALDVGRAAAVSTVTRSRLLGDCACVAALLVRAETSALNALGSDSNVRVVEALPADAIYGRFAVNPLLPEQTDVVGVAADDGPVPQS